MLRKLGKFIFDTLQVIVFAVSIFLFLYLLVLQPHKIKGHSMDPNFDDGQFLLTDKLSYRFGNPKRGDVVVFESPISDQDFIKRIVGLPSENIFIQSGKVFIDGDALIETNLPTDSFTKPGKFSREGVTVQVPANSYFLLGDNRDNSLDSRAFGFVQRDAIVGNAWFTYWPPNTAGTIDPPIYKFSM